MSLTLNVFCTGCRTTSQSRDFPVSLGALVRHSGGRVNIKGEAKGIVCGNCEPIGREHSFTLEFSNREYQRIAV